MVQDILTDLFLCIMYRCFFFASGLFAGKLENLSLREAVKKKVDQILVPYIFLVVVNMIVLVLLNQANFITYIKYVKQFIWGIRNHVPIAAMWFFSCLFCTAIIFDVLRRVLKKKSLLLVTSLFIYLITITILPNRPNAAPSWFFNLDSALYYLIYYTVGYMVGSLLINQHFMCAFKMKPVFGIVGIAILFFYIFTVYEEMDLLGEVLLSIPVLGLFYPIIRALLIIMGNVVVAKALEQSKIIAYIGSQTLWLCGNESVAKYVMEATVGILGLSIDIKSALAAIVYANILSLFIIYLLMPLEKKVFNYCIDFLGRKEV